MGLDSLYPRRDGLSATDRDALALWKRWHAGEILLHRFSYRERQRLLFLRWLIQTRHPDGPRSLLYWPPDPPCSGDVRARLASPRLVLVEMYAAMHPPQGPPD